MEDKKIYILVGVAVFAYILIRMVFNRLIRLKKLKKEHYALDIACFEYTTLKNMVRNMTFPYAYIALDSDNFKIARRAGDEDHFECQFGIMVCTVYRDKERKIPNSEFLYEEDGCRLSEFVDIFDSTFCDNYSHINFNINKFITRHKEYAGYIPFRDI